MFDLWIVKVSYDPKEKMAKAPRGNHCTNSLLCLTFACSSFLQLDRGLKGMNRLAVDSRKSVLSGLNQHNTKRGRLSHDGTCLAAF